MLPTKEKSEEGITFKKGTVKMIFNPMYSPNMPLNRMAGYARREAHFAQRNRFRTVGLHKEAERLEKAHHKEEALEALLHITYDLLG